MSVEKRVHPRLERPFECTWNGTSGRRDVRITSLSLGGCFIDSVGTPAVGEKLRVEVRLDDLPALALSGEVVYLDRSQGFGVRFLDLPAQDERELADSLRRYGLTEPYGQQRRQAATGTVPS
ncbi:MAG: PilZ domain-containing protein [Acidobacteriota bacterium]